MVTIENGFGGSVHDGVPASSLLTLAIVFKVTLVLLKLLKMVPFTAYICLYKTVRPYTSCIIGCITYWLMLIIVSTQRSKLPPARKQFAVKFKDGLLYFR